MELEATFKNWPQAVFVVDGVGRFQYRNEAMSRFDPERAATLPDLLADPPGEVGSYLDGAGSGGPIELDVRLKQGQDCRLTLLALPGSERLLGELREADGSGGQTLQKLEEAIQAIRQLGHDMCQPLTVIMGQSEIMQLTHSQDEEINRRLEAIITESEKLEAMTRKLSQLVHGARQK